MKYRIIDLFSGAGGMTLGFADDRFTGGFECVLAVDNDPAAMATHQNCFGGESVAGNIEDWLKKTKKIPKADIVVGGLKWTHWARQFFREFKLHPFSSLQLVGAAPFSS
ncbi:site-specific DNA-cytosine methylase, partial [Oxalobacteraceae bacterium GrIS 2.11]